MPTCLDSSKECVRKISDADQSLLLRWIAYRYHGHNACNLDPLNLTLKKKSRLCNPDVLGCLKVADDTTSPEFFMLNISERRWFRFYLESFERCSFYADEKKRMFELLAKSEVFDQFMTKSFPQVKRYGLEGAESMMVTLDAIFKEANRRNNEFPDDEPAMGDVLLTLELPLIYPTAREVRSTSAQFGDFFNGAQIILDVFVSCGETMWLTETGIVVLLPHGYDGAGPDHSSARIERFMQICDQRYDVRNDALPDNPNICVVNLTRTSMSLDARKPLIIAGPKILLRHPSAVSPLSASAPGTTFEPLLSDPAPHIPANAQGPTRVLFVSGKLFYELHTHRKKSPPRFPVAIVRVVELHHFPTDLVERELERLGNELFGQVGGAGWWVQEEPQNMGAWSFVAPGLEALLPEVTKAATAPAIGVSSRHKVEKAKLIQDVILTP
ncbi:Transketolase, pyrimidine binding domain-containing protein [Cladochytrium replicatum]|nr:Transketolase, pyrimidine binding domain-containing protein [Cladochytrium replicatum]